ncbi:hypothetical protein V5799_028163 [Amblyomma americanum]|uniref:Lipocalin n=1 Tax=Amblyomma americanum TaxID=6943 RepID=A0AAQ4DDN0_AMBAM
MQRYNWCTLFLFRDYYTQTFIFQLDPGTKKYNKMMSLEPSGAPNGNYKFLSTDPLCIVIKALSFELPPNGTVIPQERDADNAENVHGPYDCMLWIKDDKQTTPDDCCRDYFKKLCHYTAVRQAFSKIECEKRPSESNPEDDSKTVTY